STYIGQTVWLAGVVSNAGNASTGSSFKANLEVLDSTQTKDLENNVVTVSTLAAGGNQAVSNMSGNDFPTAGTYYYRVCADEDASFNGTITESNEGNNCSTPAKI